MDSLIYPSIVTSSQETTIKWRNKIPKWSSPNGGRWILPVGVTLPVNHTSYPKKFISDSFFSEGHEYYLHHHVYLSTQMESNTRWIRMRRQPEESSYFYLRPKHQFGTISKDCYIKPASEEELMLYTGAFFSAELYDTQMNQGNGFFCLPGNINFISHAIRYSPTPGPRLNMITAASASGVGNISDSSLSDKEKDGDETNVPLSSTTAEVENVLLNETKSSSKAIPSKGKKRPKVVDVDINNIVDTPRNKSRVRSTATDRSLSHTPLFSRRRAKITHHKLPSKLHTPRVKEKSKGVSINTISPSPPLPLLKKSKIGKEDLSPPHVVSTSIPASTTPEGLSHEWVQQLVSDTIKNTITSMNLQQKPHLVSTVSISSEEGIPALLPSTVIDLGDEESSDSDESSVSTTTVSVKIGSNNTIVEPPIITTNTVATLVTAAAKKVERARRTLERKKKEAEEENEKVQKGSMMGILSYVHTHHSLQSHLSTEALKVFTDTVESLFISEIELSQLRRDNKKVSSELKKKINQELHIIETQCTTAFRHHIDYVIGEIRSKGNHTSPSVPGPIFDYITHRRQRVIYPVHQAITIVRDQFVHAWSDHSKYPPLTRSSSVMRDCKFTKLKEAKIRWTPFAPINSNARYYNILFEDKVAVESDDLYVPLNSPSLLISKFDAPSQSAAIISPLLLPSHPSQGNQQFNSLGLNTVNSMMGNTSQFPFMPSSSLQPIITQSSPYFIPSRSITTCKTSSASLNSVLNHSKLSYSDRIKGKECHHAITVEPDDDKPRAESYTYMYSKERSRNIRNQSLSRMNDPSSANPINAGRLLKIESDWILEYSNRLYNIYRHDASASHHLDIVRNYIFKWGCYSRQVMELIYDTSFTEVPDGAFVHDSLYTNRLNLIENECDVEGFNSEDEIEPSPTTEDEDFIAPETAPVEYSKACMAAASDARRMADSEEKQHSVNMEAAKAASLVSIAHHPRSHSLSSPIHKSSTGKRHHRIRIDDDGNLPSPQVDSKEDTKEEDDDLLRANWYYHNGHTVRNNRYTGGPVNLPDRLKGKSVPGYIPGGRSSRQIPSLPKRMQPTTTSIPITHSHSSSTPSTRILSFPNSSYNIQSSSNTLSHQHSPITHPSYNHGSSSQVNRIAQGTDSVSDTSIKGRLLKLDLTGPFAAMQPDSDEFIKETNIVDGLPTVQYFLRNNIHQLGRMENVTGRSIIQHLTETTTDSSVAATGGGIVRVTLEERQIGIAKPQAHNSIPTSTTISIYHPIPTLTNNETCARSFIRKISEYIIDQDIPTSDRIKFILDHIDHVECKDYIIKHSPMGRGKFEIQYYQLMIMLDQYFNYSSRITYQTGSAPFPTSTLPTIIASKCETREHTMVSEKFILNLSQAWMDRKRARYEQHNTIHLIRRGDGTATCPHEGIAQVKLITIDSLGRTSSSLETFLYANMDILTHRHNVETTEHAMDLINAFQNYANWINLYPSQWVSYFIRWLTDNKLKQYLHHTQLGLPNSLLSNIQQWECLMAKVLSFTTNIIIEYRTNAMDSHRTELIKKNRLPNFVINKNVIQYSPNIKCRKIKIIIESSILTEISAYQRLPLVLKPYEEVGVEKAIGYIIYAQHAFILARIPTSEWLTIFTERLVIDLGKCLFHQPPILFILRGEDTDEEAWCRCVEEFLEYVSGEDSFDFFTNAMRVVPGSLPQLSPSYSQTRYIYDKYQINQFHYFEQSEKEQAMIFAALDIQRLLERNGSIQLTVRLDITPGTLNGIHSSSYDDPYQLFGGGTFSLFKSFITYLQDEYVMRSIPINEWTSTLRKIVVDYDLLKVIPNVTEIKQRSNSDPVTLWNHTVLLLLCRYFTPDVQVLLCSNATYHAFFDTRHHMDRPCTDVVIYESDEEEEDTTYTFNGIFSLFSHHISLASHDKLIIIPITESVKLTQNVMEMGTYSNIRPLTEMTWSVVINFIRYLQDLLVHRGIPIDKWEVIAHQAIANYGATTRITAIQTENRSFINGDVYKSWQATIMGLLQSAYPSVDIRIQYSTNAHAVVEKLKSAASTISINLLQSWQFPPSEYFIARPHLQITNDDNTPGVIVQLHLSNIVRPFSAHPNYHNNAPVLPLFEADTFQGGIEFLSDLQDRLISFGVSTSQWLGIFPSLIASESIKTKIINFINNIVMEERTTSKSWVRTAAAFLSLFRTLPVNYYISNSMDIGSGYEQHVIQVSSVREAVAINNASSSSSTIPNFGARIMQITAQPSSNRNLPFAFRFDSANSFSADDYVLRSILYLRRTNAPSREWAEHLAWFCDETNLTSELLNIQIKEFEHPLEHFQRVAAHLRSLFATSATKRRSYQFLLHQLKKSPVETAHDFVGRFRQCFKTAYPQQQYNSKSAFDGLMLSLDEDFRDHARYYSWGGIDSISSISLSVLREENRHHQYFTEMSTFERLVVEYYEIRTKVNVVESARVFNEEENARERIHAPTNNVFSAPGLLSLPAPHTYSELIKVKHGMGKTCFDNPKPDITQLNYLNCLSTPTANPTPLSSQVAATSNRQSAQVNQINSTSTSSTGGGVQRTSRNAKRKLALMQASNNNNDATTTVNYVAQSSTPTTTGAKTNNTQSKPINKGKGKPKKNNSNNTPLGMKPDPTKGPCLGCCLKGHDWITCNRNSGSRFYREVNAQHVGTAHPRAVAEDIEKVKSLNNGRIGGLQPTSTNQVNYLRIHASGMQEIIVPGFIGTVPIDDILIDTGANISMLSGSWYNEHKEKLGPLYEGPDVPVHGPDGRIVPTLGCITLSVTIPDKNNNISFSCKEEFTISTILNVNALAGMPFLRKLFSKVDINDGSLSFLPSLRPDFGKSRPEDEQRSVPISLTKGITIPANHIGTGEVSFSPLDTVQLISTYVCTPHDSIHNIIKCPCHLVDTRKESKLHTYVTTFTNPFTKTITIPVGTIIAYGTSINNIVKNIIITDQHASPNLIQHLTITPPYSPTTPSSSGCSSYSSDDYNVPYEFKDNGITISVQNGTLSTDSTLSRILSSKGSSTPLSSTSSSPCIRSTVSCSSSPLISTLHPQRVGNISTSPVIRFIRASPTQHSKIVIGEAKKERSDIQKELSRLSGMELIYDQEFKSEHDQSIPPIPTDVPVMEFNINPSLSKSDRDDLTTMLKSIPHAFASNSKLNVPMESPGVVHTIQLINPIPCKQGAYKYSPEKKAEVERQVAKLIERGIIEPSYSPWSSPILLVRKADGSWRMCIDYRRVNEQTHDDAYPIPVIRDCLDMCKDANWYSSLDIKDAYYHVAVDPRSIPITAFVAPTGLYQFKRMPFGLSNAPATYQRYMDHVLRKFIGKSCAVFFDDCLVFTSGSLKQHIDHIYNILKELAEHGLEGNITKCKFGYKEILFVGHILRNGTILPDPTKQSAVNDFPIPINVTTLKSFLGLVTYYHKFINGFASIAEPLYRLTRKNVDFIIGEKEMDAFKKLKSALTSAPCLYAPNFNLPFILQTDASGIGIGGVLAQIIKGDEHPIAFISRQLNGAERNYSATEWECLAVVWCISQLEPFLIDRTFTIVTDHSALQWLPRHPFLNTRMVRWADKLKFFNFIVLYRKGVANGNADALSRCPRLNTAPPITSEYASVGVCPGDEPSHFIHRIGLVTTTSPSLYRISIPSKQHYIPLPHCVPHLLANKLLFSILHVCEGTWTVQPASIKYEEAAPLSLGSLECEKASIMRCCVNSNKRKGVPRTHTRPVLTTRQIANTAIDYEVDTDTISAGSVHHAPSNHYTTTGYSIIDLKAVDKIVIEQYEDVRLKEIISFITGKLTPSNLNDSEIQAFIKKCKNFTLLPQSEGISDGLYYAPSAPKRGMSSLIKCDPRLVIPLKHRSLIIQLFHDTPSGGHFGIRRTYRKIQFHYYWDTLLTDVTQYVKSCTVCAEMKVMRNKAHVPLGILSQPTHPFELISMDFVGPMKVKSENFEFILVIVDHFSRWVITIPTINMKSETVAAVLVDEVFNRYGVPNRILSDNGPQFKSQLSIHLHRMLRIKLLFSAAHHPQANGMVERANATIKELLTTVGRDFGNQWVRVLTAVTFSYNTSVHESTGFTPYYALFGREAATIGDALAISAAEGDQDFDVPMEAYVELIHDDQIRAAEHIHALFDKRDIKNLEARQKIKHIISYHVGQEVWWRNHQMDTTIGGGHGSHSQWLGPFIISKCHSELTYSIMNKSGKGAERKVHIGQLKPHISRDEKITDVEMKSPSPLPSLQSMSTITPSIPTPPTTSVISSSNDINIPKISTSLFKSKRIMKRHKHNSKINYNDDLSNRMPARDQWTRYSLRRRK